MNQTTPIGKIIAISDLNVTILATGQDKIQPEPEPPSSSQYGFTRGAEYYDRRKTEC